METSRMPGGDIMNTTLTIKEVFCSPEHPLNKIVTTAVGKIGRNRYKVIEPMTIDKCLSLFNKYEKSFGDNATFQEAYGLSTHEFVLIRIISKHMAPCKSSKPAKNMITNIETHLKDLLRDILCEHICITECNDLLILVDLGFKSWEIRGQMESMKSTICKAINAIENYSGDAYEGRTNHTGFHGDDIYQAVNDLKHLIGTEDKLQTYHYSCTSPVIWTSFDHGTVQAYTSAHACHLAKEELKDDLQNVNKILQQIDYNIEMDINNVDVRVVS